MIILFIVCSSTCHASWLIYHKPEYRGRVVDIDTGQPIEGAVVIAKYEKETFAPPVEPKSSVIHVKETLTDKDGRFVFPSYITIIQPFSWSYDVSFLIFKPGYLCYGWSVLEDMFSGKDDAVVERNPIWNKKIKYRFDVSGTILLPKITSYEDRSNSLGEFYLPLEYIKQLPISKKLEHDEITLLNLIRGNQQ